MTRFKLLLGLLLVGIVQPISAGQDVIQCANLIYGGTHKSRCFSDEFLSEMQKETAIPTERNFRSVKLESDELFSYPFVMITGEQSFLFTEQERENLEEYLCNGGFMLASAGCSSKTFDEAFRKNIKSIFGEERPLVKIDMDHPLFRTVYDIKEIKLKRAVEEPPALEGIEIDGKLVLIYSPHGLNDTSNTEGCCCCGGNEIKNALEINANVLVYSLLH